MSAPPPAVTPPEIRPFRDGDRSQVIALWRDCGLTIPANDPTRDIDFCRISGHGEVFVAELGGMVVGTVMAGHDGHRGWLYYVATSPDFRGRGLARTLVRHAEAWLANKGVAKIELMIRDTNTVVRSFYEKIGYELEPRLIMSRRLAPPADQRPSVDGVAGGQLKMVVTYLEMLQPPRVAAPPVPLGKIAVLRADNITVPFYRYLYNTVGRDWIWYTRRLMSDGELKAAISDPAIDIYVLYVAGEPAGYAELDRRVADEIELVYFGLLPAYVGRRLGPWFLHWAIDAAWRTKPNRVWVHTCNFDHPKAITMYQRAGFAPYDQKTSLISDPRPLP
jgi:GNAT superfamily N-acetyltransferase